MGGLKISRGENQSHRIGFSFALLLSFITIVFFFTYKSSYCGFAQTRGRRKTEKWGDLEEGLHDPSKLRPDRMSHSGSQELCSALLAPDQSTPTF